MSRNESIATAAVGTSYDTVKPLSIDADFEAHWTTWRARGVAHERAVRRKFLMLAPALAIAAAVAYVLLSR